MFIHGHRLRLSVESHNRFERHVAAPPPPDIVNKILSNVLTGSFRTAEPEKQNERRSAGQIARKGSQAKFSHYS